MPETKPELPSGVAKTLLIPLYMRALESQRPDALIRDEKAVALVMQSGLDFSQVRQIRMSELLNVMRNLFTREFDRYARDFIGRPPEAVVVHSPGDAPFPVPCHGDRRLSLSNLTATLAFSVLVVLILKRGFGDEYQDYCARTPRYLGRIRTRRL